MIRTSSLNLKNTIAWYTKCNTQGAGHANRKSGDKGLSILYNMGNEKGKINSVLRDRFDPGLRAMNYAIVLFVQCRGTVAVDLRCHAIGRFKITRFYLNFV